MDETGPAATNGRRKVDEPGPVDAAPPPRLAFGPFVLDPETGRLMEGDRILPLAPKPFDVLLYLARRPGRVVPKSDLMEKLWPGTFVTDDVLVQSVVEIRRALGDDAKLPRYVQTLPRRGYQFLVDVTEAAGSLSAAPVAAPEPSEEPVADRGPARWTPLQIGVTSVLLVAILGFAGWRLRTRTRTAADVEPGSLVILPLAVEEATPQSGWLRQGIAEMLRAQLGQTPEVRVLARHRVAGALNEAGYDDARGFSFERAAGVARKLRAERFVTGSFVRVDERFVLAAQVVDTATGRTLGSSSVRGRHPGELLEAVDELSVRLLHHLRTRGAGERAWRPTRLTTRSVEASRHYTEALSQFARGGREGALAAEESLDQALQLDPSFAQAYVKKAEVLQWRRTLGYGDPDPAPAILAASRLVKDLPARERLLVESFEALILRRQPEAALKHWNALLQLHPTYAQEVGVPALVAETLMTQGRWDELTTVGEANVDSPALPDGDRAWLCVLLADAFVHRGEYPRALQYARRAVETWPSRTGPRYLSQRTTLGRISLEAGHRDEAIAEFAGVRDAAEADATNLTQAAWGFYMAGDREEAERVVARAVTLDPSYGNAYHLRGWLQLARGDLAAAAESLSTAFERTPPSFGTPHQGLVNGDLAALYYAGVARLKLGHRDAAAQALDSLAAHCRRLQLARQSAGIASDWQVAAFLTRVDARLGRPTAELPRLPGDDLTYFVQAAKLHAVLGRREEALRELAQAIRLGHGERPHLEDDPDFDSIRDDPEFKRLVSGTGPG